MTKEFASLAQRKVLELQVEACADSVRSDPSLTEQVVRNLVSNAIKPHSARPGAVALTA